VTAPSVHEEPKATGTPEYVYAEDLMPDQAWDLGSHTLTEEEIVSFARQWDPHFFHIDPERAAAEGHFGGLIASGLQTLGVYQRLWADQLSGHLRLIAGAGLDDVRFRRPVRPGDRLTGRSAVTSVDLEPARRRGRVGLRGVLHNQHGDPVLGLASSVYVEMRVA
jgi:acyl dehydratase